MTFDNAAYMRNRYQEHKDDPAFRTRLRVNHRNWYQRHKDEPAFREKHKAAYRDYYKRVQNDPAFQEKFKRKAKQRWGALWESILAQHDSRCHICGESDKVVLELHHKNGDGAVDRKQLARSKLLADAIQCPERYEVLCANCHTRAHLGVGRRRLTGGQP